MARLPSSVGAVNWVSSLLLVLDHRLRKDLRPRLARLHCKSRLRIAVAAQLSLSRGTTEFPGGRPVEGRVLRPCQRPEDRRIPTGAPAPAVVVSINTVATERGPEGRTAFTVDARTTGQLGGWTTGAGAPVLVLHGGPGLSFSYLEG